MAKKSKVVVEDEASVLRARVQHLEDQLKARKKEVRNLTRRDNIFEAISQELDERIGPLKPLPTRWTKPLASQKIEEHLVMHLSDEHADEVVLSSEVDGFEKYNMSIALERAERYVNTVIEHSQRNLKNYTFPVLWILAYGDHTTGEIHDSTNHSEYRNAMKNALAVGQMHALMIRDLAPFFKKVNVLYLSGNHGRRTIKKDYHGAHQNWDYLIAEICKLRSASLDNVEIMIPEAYSFIAGINGHDFCVSHGDDVRSWNSIPWYGIERRTRRLTALHSSQGRNIKYFVFGHFHTGGMLPNLNGETIINGSWIATSPYVHQALASFIEPYQWLHGVHAKRGITWRMQVHLRGTGRKEKLTRYKCVLDTVPRRG